MVIIDENKEVSNWITSLDLDNLGFTNIDIATFEIANGLENELFLVQDTVLEQVSPVVLDKFSRVSAIIIYKTFDQKTKFNLSNIIAEVAKNSDTTLVKNSLLFLEEQIKSNLVLKTQLMTLNSELNEALRGVSINLQRVKKTYERITPKRLESLKGVLADL